MSVFLTGTDTGVGKTYTAVCLLRLLRARGLRCAGMKPICCGDRDDAEKLLAASSEGLSIDEVNPVWLRTPAAPLAAALIEGVTVETRTLVEGFLALQRRFDFVVVEGVGGWLVPIGEDYFVSDLAVDLQLPVVIVAMNRLGCLNHTMLTARSVASHGLPCAGVALNGSGAPVDFAEESNADILSRIAQVPICAGLSQEMTELPPDWVKILNV